MDLTNYLCAIVLWKATRPARSTQAKHRRCEMHDKAEILRLCIQGGMASSALVRASAQVS
jgi:hypothetical protein